MYCQLWQASYRGHNDLHKSHTSATINSREVTMQYDQHALDWYLECFIRRYPITLAYLRR